MNTKYLDWEFGQREGDIVADNAKTMTNLFNYCSEEYKATESGCQKILDEWKRNKGDLFDERFKSIEGYDAENHCIILNVTRMREIDANVIIDFWGNYVYGNPAFNCLVLSVLNGRTRDEWRNAYRVSSPIINALNSLPASCIDYHGAREWREMHDRAFACYNAMSTYTDESAAEYEIRKKVYRLFKNYYQQLCDEAMARALNEYYPDLKAVSGQKMSKIALKVLRKWGINNDIEFERQFARYADAINPLEVTDKLIISWNPFDYLTMSFGNSWSSCHTIDKENKHGYNNDAYHGCYSAGTLSYMLDSSSIVVYSISGKANTPYWNEPKLARQMFHINLDGDTFIQGRRYPDDQTDRGHSVAYSAYKHWREILQDIFAKAYKNLNSWKNASGYEACSRKVNDSDGMHYQDYRHYNNCNINRLSRIDCANTIKIGHSAICPKCGQTHRDSTEWCWCGECRDTVECEACGEIMDRDDAYWDEERENYYCYNCTHYCDYHERREYDNGNFTYIHGYGDVCERGINELLDNDEIMRCNNCNDYYRIGDMSIERDDYGDIVSAYCRNCR